MVVHIIHAEGGQVVNSSPQADSLCNHGRSRLKPAGCWGIGGMVQEHILNHLATALERGHFIEQLLPASAGIPHQSLEIEDHFEFEQLPAGDHAPIFSVGLFSESNLAHLCVNAQVNERAAQVHYQQQYACLAAYHVTNTFGSSRLCVAERSIYNANACVWDCSGQQVMQLSLHLHETAVTKGCSHANKGFGKIRLGQIMLQLQQGT